MKILLFFSMALNMVSINNVIALEIIPYGPNNFYWINQGDEVLVGGMSYPDSKDPEKDLPQALKAFNVGVVINLTEDDFSQPQKYINCEIEEARIVIEDFTAPTIEQIHAFIKKVDDYMVKGKNVVVHCRGGKGRTGTMMACWLDAKKGYSSKEAIDQVRRYSEHSVETAKQEEIIKNFYDDINKK